MNIREAYTQWSATYDNDHNLTRDLDQVVTRNMLGHARYTSVLEIVCCLSSPVVLRLPYRGGSIARKLGAAPLRACPWLTSSAPLPNSSARKRRFQFHICRISPSPRRRVGQI